MGEDYGDAESAYLVAVKEDIALASSTGSVFGVCFVDACIGTFHVCSISPPSSPAGNCIHFVFVPECSCHSSLMIDSALGYGQCLLTIIQLSFLLSVLTSLLTPLSLSTPYSPLLSERR